MNTMTEPCATLVFLQDQPGDRIKRRGDIRPGGRLVIEYDLGRMRTIGSTFGMEYDSWDFTAYVRFHPGGQPDSGSLVEHCQGATSPKGFEEDYKTPGIYYRPIPFKVMVPPDATQVELWFVRTLYSASVPIDTRYDSRHGQNYWFAIAREGPTIPKQSVGYRAGSLPNLEMVNVFEDRASKVLYPFPGSLGSLGPPVGRELRTLLLVKARVKNVATDVKHVWVDVHVFDSVDELIHSETFTLHYLEPAGGNGDFFELDDMIYRGSGATPGSVWFGRDATKVQYRLYYEVNNQVFTDAILHQHELPEDGSCS